MNDNVVAFIPARGGSKRLPRKNCMDFNGRPLIYYSIKFAQISGIQNILVSTDDDEIAAISQSFGAEIIWRPTELASDFATTADAAKHCLFEFEKKNGATDYVVTLQPTNPLRPRNLVVEAFQQFKYNEFDAIISVSKNKHKLGELKKSEFRPILYTPGQRSQDIKSYHYENGLIYISKAENIRKGDFWGSKTQAFETDELYAMADIDTLFDFKLAEYLFGCNASLFTHLS